MVATYSYVMPFHEINKAKGAGVDYTSAVIEIPWYATVWHVQFDADVAGTLHMRKDVNGTYETFDSVPIVAGALPVTRVYSFRVPFVKFVFESVGAGSFNLYSEITSNTR